MSFHGLIQKKKPHIGMLTLDIPWDSPCIVESKSLKLYLNTWHLKSIESQDQMLNQMKEALSKVCQAPIRLKLLEQNACEPFFKEEKAVKKSKDEPYIFLDKLNLEVLDWKEPQPGLLKVQEGGQKLQTFLTHLFKSNCPVTGQPDWASVWIQVQGRVLEPASILSYLISFRHHQDFHEHCIERIFCDLWQTCKAETLSVFGRFLRRGGIDINPFRSNDPKLLSKKILPLPRLYRQ